MDKHDSFDESLGFTPHPEGPLPGPLPGPIPGPLPGPFPGPVVPRPFPLPEDWWRCRRLGPVSGRYEGEMVSPTAGRYILDLRVDIDPRYANSPVLDRISGDIYDAYRFSLPGGRTFRWRVYRESWIVDAPRVTWSRCMVEITGTVRYWKGIHPATTIRVRIPWSTFTAAGPAEVTFTPTGSSPQSYSCTRRSDCFRDLNLEVDVAQSVNAEPVLPAYDTHAHPTRPADLPRRTVTVEEAYREAGVCVRIRPDRTIIDDSAPQFTSWSDAELHDAMETHFSQIGGSWPRWEMWGLMAGRFDSAGVGGIMFDAAAAYGGAGEPPERQGFAVFRNHQWFDNLAPGAPTSNAQAEALRKWLYVWVHEAGHAFNFLHSWNKNRPDSLSWMNYDWRYDNRNGADSFWSNFRLRFDDEELIHLRHGDRASVIMGGDPWASGGHIEAPPGAEHLWAPPGAMAQVEGTAPVELLARSKEYFEFLEPVSIEFRIRNLLPDLPLTVDARLNPEFGGLIVYIRRPDGRIVEYDPIMCKLATPELRTLQPRDTAVAGADRYSESVLLSYGQYGFYVDEPGEYLVRGLYQGPGDLLVPSNVHRFRVGHPASRDQDRLAQDFFSYEVGMSLYLGGSPSPFLAKGMEVLESVADRFEDSIVGAKAAATVAESEAWPFFRVQDAVLKEVQSGDPEAAVAATQAALEVFRREQSPALNLEYHDLVRSRAEWMAAMGESARARDEVLALREDLAARNVNESVLEEITIYANDIADTRAE